MRQDLPNIDSELVEVEPAIYHINGKNVIIGFDEYFDKDDSKLNNFIIQKSAYTKNLPMICRYANTFCNFYDTEKEFLTGLLSIKYQIDNNKYNYTLHTFESDIADCLFTDNVISKIFEMVEDYYNIDLTAPPELKEIDMHALEFLNEHGKSLMALSIAYKLTIPVVCHYYFKYSDKMASIAKIKGEQEMNIKSYLYHVFASYFPLFQKDINLYNKLAATVNNHLSQTRVSDKIMWERAKNRKLTPSTYSDKLVSSIVVDLLPKAVFDKNIVTLIQVAIPYQIKQTLMVKDKYDFSELTTMPKSNDELSGLEKLEATNARIDDLNIIISDINIKDTIHKIERFYNIYPTKDEINYYRDNLHNFAFSDIVLQFFSKFFGGFYDLKSISKKNYIRLMIIFKKALKDMGYVYITQILTGNKSQSIKRRKIADKQLKKIENSARFQKLMKNYSMVLTNETFNPILNNIATLINTPIEWCDYDDQKNYGEQIQVDIDIVVDEYLKFLQML